MLKLILLLTPVYVTLFWALVLIFDRSRKHSPKIFLGKFMSVAFIIYLSHFFYFTGQYEIYLYLDSIYTMASLSVYPLYYIYVRMLTVDSGFSPSVHLKYLALPAAVFLLHLTGYLIMDKSDAIYYLSTVLPGVYPGQYITGYMKIIYNLFRIVFIFQAIIYLYMNYRLISSHNEKLQELYSNIERRNLDWVQFFNFSLAITSVSSVLAVLIGRDMFAASEIHLAVPSVIFSLMLFIIGLLGNTQREVYTEQQNPAEMTVKENPPDRLDKMMEDLFEKRLIFKDTDLKIWDVCNMLGTNRTYVSRIINNYYGRNFCNHVNFYRVEYAKKLIRQNRGLTNQEVAELSGFGSVNSLYRAFTSIENKTVGEFRKTPSS